MFEFELTSIDMVKSWIQQSSLLRYPRDKVVKLARPTLPVEILTQHNITPFLFYFVFVFVSFFPFRPMHLGKLCCLVPRLGTDGMVIAKGRSNSCWR